MELVCDQRIIKVCCMFILFNYAVQKNTCVHESFIFACHKCVMRWMPRLETELFCFHISFSSLNFHDYTDWLWFLTCSAILCHFCIFWATMCSFICICLPQTANCEVLSFKSCCRRIKDSCCWSCRWWSPNSRRPRSMYLFHSLGVKMLPLIKKILHSRFLVIIDA